MLFLLHILNSMTPEFHLFTQPILMDYVFICALGSADNFKNILEVTRKHESIFSWEEHFYINWQMVRRVHSVWWKSPHIFAVLTRISEGLAQPKWLFGYFWVLGSLAQCGISFVPLEALYILSGFPLLQWLLGTHLMLQSMEARLRCRSAKCPRAWHYDTQRPLWCSLRGLAAVDSWQCIFLTLQIYSSSSHDTQAAVAHEDLYIKTSLELSIRKLHTEYCSCGSSFSRSANICWVPILFRAVC